MNFAKEKADELFNKYYQLTNPTPDSNDIWIFTYTMKELAKKSALIAINEMLDFRNALFINEGSLIHQHLLDVKTEIEKL
jgi:hypothetical protein